MYATSRDPRAEHVAAFARTEDFVVERVASFIAEGLASGEYVVAMSTVAHWNAVAERLEHAGVAYGRATNDGRLVFVDAQEILDAITENGAVDAARFRDMLRPLLKPATRTRVYGEVVSLLAARGEIEAAIELERLGHELAHVAGIPILCGYHLDGSRTLTADDMARLREVHDRSVVETFPVTSPLLPAISTEAQFHAVRFYQDRESLARIVGQFLGQGFVAGSPAIVIATPEHRHAITRVLSAQFFDVGRLEAAGELIIVDAAATLAEFMVEGMPDPDRFNGAVIPLLERACRGRSDCVVRAYGEMVDLLWQAGRNVAAVRLETLWNQLANSHRFALLCGYSMGHFYKHAAHQEICRHHTHVVADTGDATAIH